MKKPNINLNLDAIKKWGLEHGEKVAFGVVGALFFFFFYGLITTDRYEGRTDGLSNATRKARTNLDLESSWDNSGEAKNFVNQDYDAQAKKLTTPTNVDDYVWDIGMYRPLEAGGGRAREPKFLTLVDPIASSGKGAFELIEDKDEDDDDSKNRRSRKKMEGFRWVAFRAVVPAGLQRAEFIDALNLPGPGAPSAEPIYTNVVFQRRQLTVNNSWSEWEKVDLLASVQVMSRIQLGGTEVVTSSQTGQLTARLPTREGRKWTDREVGHPRFESRDPKEEADKPAVEENLAQPEAGELNQFGRPVGQRGQRGRGRVTSESRIKQDARKIQEARLRRQRGRGARANANDDVRLFRLFDFTVEPDHTYQYRVQLVLNNPNYDRPAREVLPIAGAELQPNEGEVRTTAWSKETAAVYVDTDVTYYVDQFIERGRGDGGNVQVDLVRWDKDTGEFDSIAMSLYKGQVISNKRSEISTSNFVVDFTGGALRLSQILEGEEILPAEMLVANESGELIVRTERTDDDAHSIIQLKTKRKDRDEEDESSPTNGGATGGFTGFNR